MIDCKIQTNHSNEQIVDAMDLSKAKSARNTVPKFRPRSHSDRRTIPNRFSRTRLPRPVSQKFEDSNHFACYLLFQPIATSVLF